MIVLFVSLHQLNVLLLVVLCCDLLGPHIVIVPKSVVGNWIREFKKWCPAIRAVKMGGTKEERETFIKNELDMDSKTKRHKFDVVVTSYEGMLKEKGKFSKISWNYVIIGTKEKRKMCSVCPIKFLNHCFL